MFCVGLIIFFNTKRGNKWLDSLDLFCTNFAKILDLLHGMTKFVLVMKTTMFILHHHHSGTVEKIEG